MDWNFKIAYKGRELAHPQSIELKGRVEMAVGEPAPNENRSIGR